MPLVLADRVKDTTTTTGTGTITLSGTAPIGYVSFGTAIGNGNTTYYTITAGSEWEVGIGTYTAAGTTLSRDTVLASSAGGTTKVTFSAGTKDVFVTYPAGRSIANGFGTLPAANGGTGLTSPGTSANVLTSNGTAWVSSAPPSSAVQYPQNSQSANYTLVLGDAGKQIFHPASDAAIRTYTIPANASVAFPIGTVVLFTAENGGPQVNVAINSDTLVRGGGLTGSAVVPSNNTLMCIKVTATKWMANYLFETPYAPITNVAMGHSTSPFVTAYPFSASTGFGTKYSDPGSLAPNTCYGIAYNSSNTAVATACDTSPYVIAYSWSTSTGFGSRYSNPATLPTGFAVSVAFTRAENAIAFAHGTSPFVTAYPWSNSTGFGTKFANPATLPPGTGRGVAFTSSGNAIAVTSDASPYITVYPWSGSGFGVKFADPSTLPTGLGRGVDFSPSGDAIAVSHSTSPFITVYPWSVSGFGTKFANPATLPTGNAITTAFSPAGDTILVGHNGTPYVNAYPWSTSGFGTKYADPATQPTGGGNVAFSPFGNAIAVAHNNSPYITAYPWNSSTGFGVKYADPATLPAGNGQGVAFGSTPL